MTGVDLSAMVVTVQRLFRAPVPDVWALLSDLPRMATFSREVESLTWLDASTFTATNRSGGFAWTITGHVVERREQQVLRWTVLEPASPSSTWSYALLPCDAGTLVTHRFAHGPGFSLVRRSVDADPSSAPRIVRERSAQLQADMQDSLQLAERWLVAAPQD